MSEGHFTTEDTETTEVIPNSNIQIPNKFEIQISVEKNEFF
jgi:hypothetical protein